jgi:hypothetical protein
MSPEEIATGEALARAATPGPWSADSGDQGAFVFGPDGDSLFAAHWVSGLDNGDREANCAFVATHSPDRLLALYADLKKARAALEWIKTNVTSPVWLGGAEGRWIPGDGSGGSGGVALVARALSEVSRGG